jgi:hypothetical protein
MFKTRSWLALESIRIQGQRQLRFRGKVLNGLRLAVFGDFESVFRQIADHAPLLVLHIEEELDNIGIGFKSGDWLIRILFVFLRLGLIRSFPVLLIGHHLDILGQGDQRA